MHYDSLTSGDESSPTTEDLHGDAAVPVGGCHEAPGEEMSRHFGWGEAPTDEQMEADYAARCCEAALARRCVATGELQQASMRLGRVVSIDAEPRDGRWVGIARLSDARPNETLPQRSKDLALGAAADLAAALFGPRAA